MLFIVDGTHNNSHDVVVAKLGKDINIHIKEKINLIWEEVTWIT
jgi:hypothetical protein